MTIQENNAAAKKCLAVCNRQMAEIDAEMQALVDKLVAGETTELFVAIKEIQLRQRRKQAEDVANAMRRAIKDF